MTYIVIEYGEPLNASLCATAEQVREVLGHFVRPQVFRADLVDVTDEFLPDEEPEAVGPSPEELNNWYKGRVL